MKQEIESPEWPQFLAAFMQPDGRVIDSGQDNMTHSEGQGITMLLAVIYNDPETFSRVWNWTQEHLQVRSDKLLAWSWLPDGGVSDQNNATDGDLLVTWALALAAKQWNKKEYLEEAISISKDIRTKLVREDKRGLVLIPGNEGFERPDHLIVNLSYWVFPALLELEKIDPSDQWQTLRNTGIKLLKESRFGRWGLPPDWLETGETLTPAKEFPVRFGYDAVRIPLYLIWAKLDTPSLLEPYKKFWGYFSGARFIPAWTNLADDSIDSHDMSQGMRAIVHLSMAAPGRPKNPLPALAEDETYYSAAMLLLSKAVIADRF